MSWIVVKHLPLDQNLVPLTRMLTARGVVYRVSEEDGKQLLSVRDPDIVEPLAQLVDEFIRGELELPPMENNSAVQVNAYENSQARGVPIAMTPITLVLIVLSALGALPVVAGIAQDQIYWFTFLAIENPYPVFSSFSETMASGQYWRLLTPAFLHFSFLHFLFNSLWIWDFGRRLELALGKFQYLLIVIATAIAANFVQYFWSGSAMFGGMSGVVYALVGFIWIRHKIAPHPLFAVAPGIIGFMLFWLVFCMTGIVDAFIDGSVANAAHLGGLISGMLLGAASGIHARQAKR